MVWYYFYMDQTHNLFITRIRRMSIVIQNHWHKLREKAVHLFRILESWQLWSSTYFWHTWSSHFTFYTSVCDYWMGDGIKVCLICKIFHKKKLDDMHIYLCVCVSIGLIFLTQSILIPSNPIVLGTIINSFSQWK